MARMTARQKAQEAEEAAQAATAAKHAAMVEEQAHAKAKAEAEQISREEARQHKIRKAADALVEQLRAALLNDLHRVIDLFESLDRNGDGLVSRAEWHAALPLLIGKRQAARVGRAGGRSEVNLNAQLVDPQYQDAMDALFAGMDTDRSGHIDYKELNSSLRQGQFQRRTVSRNAAPSTRTVGFHPANKSPPPKEGGIDEFDKNSAAAECEDTSAPRKVKRRSKAEIAIERLQARSPWLPRGPPRPRAAYAEINLNATLEWREKACSPSPPRTPLAQRPRRLAESSSSSETHQLLETSGTLIRVRTSTPRTRRILPTGDWHAPPQVLPARPLVPPLEPRPLSLLDSALLGI